MCIEWKYWIEHLHFTVEFECVKELKKKQYIKENRKKRQQQQQKKTRWMQEVWRTQKKKTEIIDKELAQKRRKCIIECKWVWALHMPYTCINNLRLALHMYGLYVELTILAYSAHFPSPKQKTKLLSQIPLKISKKKHTI